MNSQLWTILQILLILLWLSADKIKAADICPENSPALKSAPLETEWAVDWWMPRHVDKLKEEGRKSARLLFLGDSITHGWETTGNDVFRKYIADYKVYNIGFSGDRTENVLWRLRHGAIDGINPEAAVLMIGTNNTGHRQDSPECTSAGILMILDELHERLPDMHVLLLAIFPRGESPDDELRMLNQEINNKIKEYGEREQVTFLDLNHIFLDDDENLSKDIMPDFLHPNEKGYQIWAEEMNTAIKALIHE